jgi:hypothetical protein
MEFLLAFQQSADTLADYAHPEKGPKIARAWQMYIGRMIEAGILRGAQNLDARRTSTVRVREGRAEVRHETPDAPMLTGFVVIDVAAIDDALVWAELSPSAMSGRTDVIPVMPIKRRPASDITA